MSRVRPALVAVLLVVASATAALAVGGSVSAPVEPGDDPVVATSENSTRVLLLTRADAAGFDGPETSVTNTLESGYADLSTDFQLKTVEHRLDAADGRDAERAVLENATDQAAEHVDELLERERRIRAAYAAGDATATQYVVALGTIHAEARSISQMLGQTSSSGTLYEYAAGYSGVRSDISHLRAKLAMVEGPVREEIAAVVHGDRDQVRVHVTVGNGVMLATIEDDQYIRETVRPDNVDDELGGTFSEATGIIQERYPWLSENSTSPSIETRGDFAFYHTASYDHGQIIAYIDTTTERVYVERHEQTLAQLPTETEVTNTANNTTLSTSRTYTGGPLLVSVNNASGAPVDATISLDGTQVGGTGIDGRLWLLSPAGDYTITADPADGPTLRANVSAPPAP
jgi:hypothetical protein